MLYFHYTQLQDSNEDDSICLYTTFTLYRGKLFCDKYGINNYPLFWLGVYGLAQLIEVLRYKPGSIPD
jgi:hypothetical protein